MIILNFHVLLAKYLILLEMVRTGFELLEIFKVFTNFLKVLVILPAAPEIRVISSMDYFGVRLHVTLIACSVSLST